MVKPNDEDYATETRKARRKGKNGTQEFFTPRCLVDKMLDKLSEDAFMDFDKTMLEPSAGNGNFVIAFLERRFAYCGTVEDVVKAVSTVYAVELMQDNVDEMKCRMMNLCKEKIDTFGGDDNAISQIAKIINSNIVCADFFKWDFENWRPIDGCI